MYKISNINGMNKETEIAVKASIAFTKKKQI